MSGKLGICCICVGVFTGGVSYIPGTHHPSVYITQQLHVFAVRRGSRGGPTNKKVILVDFSSWLAHPVVSSRG